MKELKPIRETRSDYDEIEKKIKQLFKEEIYVPLLKELKISSKTLQNSRDDLLWALQTGRLTFNLGKFSGKLNATLSKELRNLGAKFNRKQGIYSLSLRELPPDVKSAISSGSVRFMEKLEALDRKLASVIPHQLADKLKISEIFNKTLFKVDEQFKENVKHVTLAPSLTLEQRQRIADDWQNNMKLWIKDFTEKQIKELRTTVQESAFKGNRYESLISGIQASYGVSARKAKFLARQETSLLMAKHKEVRYQDSGIREYKWRAVVGTPKHPTRHRHSYLSGLSDKGKVFRFDQPPNSAEVEPYKRPSHEGPGGYFNNPGQDYNCRCVAIPVVRFKK